MNSLTIIFLLTLAQTNAPVLNDAGLVRGWTAAALCRQADVTLSTNGFWLLQWSEAATGRPWIGAAMVEGGVTNRVSLPTNEVWVRVIQKSLAAPAPQKSAEEVMRHDCSRPGNSNGLVNIGATEMIWICGCGKRGTNIYSR